MTDTLREGADRGKLKVDTIDGEQFLPRGNDGLPQTGFNNNWWL